MAKELRLEGPANSIGPRLALSSTASSLENIANHRLGKRFHFKQRWHSADTSLPSCKLS